MEHAEHGSETAGTDLTESDTNRGPLGRAWHAYMGIVRFFCPDA
ncbi:hypothetical protein [Halomicrobium mukohataei]|nr:hypothetical protein [Halomicrobium mukohataei]